MTREGTRPFAALAIAVLVALLLAACGGSDSSSSDSTATTEASTQTTAKAPRDGAGANSQNGSKAAEKAPAEKAKKGSEGSSSGASGSGSSAPAPVPLRVSGGGSEQFLTKGGDNSIQEFGEEAGESELTQAAEALHGYLVARTEEDWAKACTYLSKNEIQQLETLASQSPQLKGKGCAAVVGALSGGRLPDSTKRELTEVDAASLRTEGDQSFLLYHGARNTDYFSGMTSEGGAWKVTALAPTAFP